MVENKQPFVRNNVLGAVIFILFLVIITAILIVSMLDTDKTISEKENRTLATFPKFSVSAVLSGDFMTDFEEYYSDTFPFRDKLLSINSFITKYTSQFSAGDDGVVIIETNKTEDDFAGESLGDMVGETTDESTSTNADTPANTEG